MNIFRILFLLLGTTAAIGQSELDWAKTIDIGFPMDKPVLPNCLEATGDGDFLCGITFNSSQISVDDQLGWSFGKKDVAILHLNEYGEATQIQVFGGMGNEEVISIKRDKNGDILVLGSFEEGILKLGKQVYSNEKGKDLFLLKLDRFFEVKWSKVIGDSWFNINPNVLNISPSNEILIGGTFNCNEFFVDGQQIKNFNSSNRNDVFLIQLNTDGVAQWANSFGGESDDFINILEVSKEGDIFVAGDYNSDLLFFKHKSLANNGHRDIYLAKYDKRGNLQRAYGYGSNKMDVPTSLKITNDKKIIFSFIYEGLTFFMQDTVLTNPSKGGSDFVVSVFDNDFNLNWLRSDGNWNSVWPTHIDVDSKGNIYVIGLYDSPILKIENNAVLNKCKSVLSYDLWFAKWDKKGSFQYLKSFGGLNWEFSTGLKLIGEDEFVFTGLTESESLSLGVQSFKTVSPFNFLIAKFKKQGIYSNEGDAAKTEMSIYPTVVAPEGEITIDIENSDIGSNHTLKLIDGAGKIMFEKALIQLNDHNQFKVKLPDLVTGVYHIQLSSSKDVISKTITVQ